jgi:zinc protease
MKRGVFSAALALALLAVGLLASGCPSKATTPPPATAGAGAGDGKPLGVGETTVDVSGPPGGVPKPTVKESPPPPGPVRDAKFPPIVTTKLKNGLEVVTLESHELPTVAFALVLRSGSAQEPGDLAGLADFTGEMLKRGTKTRTADQIAEEIEFVGGSLGISTDQDYTSISLRVLTPYVDTVLGVLGDMILNPTFPEDEIKKHRDKSLADLKDLLSQSGFLVGRTMARALYGAHPYGTIVPSEDSLKKIDRKALLGFFAKNYVAANAFMVVAGDIGSADATARLEKALGKWKKGAAAKAVKPPPAVSAERVVYLVDRPGSAQTDVSLGNLAIKRTDPAWFSLYLANQVLGGSASARLFRVLRKEKGYTYGAYSRLSARMVGGAWTASINGVDVPKSIPAIRDMLGLVGALPTDPLTDDLADAKSYLTGVFATSIETIGQVASKVVDMKVFGLPADYWDTYNSKLAAVTDADAVEAAKKFVLPATGALVVVGDAKAMVPIDKPDGKPVKSLKEALREFGRVEVYDVAGKKVESLDAAPPAPAPAPGS